MSGGSQPPVSFLTDPKRVEVLLTAAEYLELEERSQARHEFVRGRRYAMAGATLPHNVISVNVLTALVNALRGTSCRAFGSDLKLNVETRDVYYYPDIFVVCGDEIDPRARFVARPRLVVEVLSDTTEWIDRGPKFEDYNAILELRNYVLIDSRRRHVELFTRLSDGRLTPIPCGSQELRLDDFGGLSLTFEAIYDGSGIH